MYKRLSVLLASAAANPVYGSDYIAPMPVYNAAAPAAPAAPALDPMMMMLLLNDDDDSSMSDLLPLMMMGGGMGGAGGAMNPLLMMSLLGDKCKASNDALDAIAFANGDDVEQDLLNELGAGEKFYTGVSGGHTSAAASDFSTAISDVSDGTIAAAFIDYDYIKCKQGGSGLSDLLPLMMMGGGMGGAGAAMDPMMMMMLLDGDSDSLLPLMMMGGLGGAPAAGGAAPAMDPMMMMLLLDGDSKMDDLLPLMMMGGMNGGAAGGMNPLMLMTLLGDSKDDDAEASDCNEEFDLEYAFSLSGTTLAKVTAEADIQAVFTTPVGSYPDVSSDGVAKDYNECLADPTDYEFSSGMSDMLPLMMMGGGSIDPMMLMLLSGNKDMDDLLPLMMMSGGMGGAGGAMDPMMMMLLLDN